MHFTIARATWSTDCFGPSPDTWWPKSRSIASRNSVVVETGNTALTWMSVPANSERRDSANTDWAAFVAL